MPYFNKCYDVMTFHSKRVKTISLIYRLIFMVSLFSEQKGNGRAAAVLVQQSFKFVELVPRHTGAGCNFSIHSDFYLMSMPSLHSPSPPKKEHLIAGYSCSCIHVIFQLRFRHLKVLRQPTLKYGLTGTGTISKDSLLVHLQTVLIKICYLFYSI